MATLLPIVSNVSGGLKETYARFFLILSLWHNVFILFYFIFNGIKVLLSLFLCTDTSRHLQISHAVTNKNASLESLKAVLLLKVVL